ncbi:SusC/RagA family TonB-linked outer membrane protein [Chryseolinea lacunae]|uniref:SusC/RagA family TonB-linked outer membrane protein n=1 Tax=Chryseolinea lacunae TaxID=2801331 RepID=A0ABS1KT79_9BACT|nr:SusC/RagA family TonB-linked outer membrane protein [Chryseolinea lacunae]MBL0742675.1 SusC/RagA family TonB-linked outer membrane protein [Chryseolinea lacunae]
MRKFLLLACLLGATLCARAQERVVSGKVSSLEDGSALPGVNVVLKGTSFGTVTNSDGAYRLSIPSADAGGTLVFSFIGLQTQEMTLGDRAVIDVQLSADVTQLSEVVVTGVGVATDKRRLAISVESVSGDRLPSIPTASIDQALVGKIAGAQIMSSSGNPGAPVSIQLRGINTLSGGTQPLIMVDGVEMRSTSLNALDLNNVERIEVVQGASAATIYGAQGANGVIQIFTKKGKQGPMHIDASARTSVDQALNIGNLHQPYNHSFTTDANGDILDNNGGLLTQDELGLWGEANWENGPAALNNRPYKNNTQYHDHIDQLFKSVRTSNYSLSLSGGKENADYAFTFSKLRQESVVQGVLDRTNFTSNIGVDLLKNLKFRSITQLIYTDNSVNPYYVNSAPLSSAMYTYPFGDLDYKDADGNYTYQFGGAGANNSNPKYFWQYQNFKSKAIDIIPTLNLHYTANKILELDYKVGINYSVNNFARETQNQEGNRSSVANNSFIGESLAGGLNKSVTNNYNINSLATATVKLDFAKDFGLNLPITSTTQLAFDWRKSNFHRQYLIYTGLPSYSDIDDINGAQSSSNSTSEYEDLFITYGYLVNQRFEYKDMAGISGGFRSDYSSTYGDAKSPFTFPRGDAYLRLSKLGFWDGITSFLPEFKIRAAYGEAGIQPVGYTLDASRDLAGGVPNHYLRIPSFKTGTVDNGFLIYSNPTFANAALQVERTKEFEYGFDFGISPVKNGAWFNYIATNVSIWNRTSHDVVWQRTLPVSQGSETIWDNYIDMESKGVQFSIDMDVYSGDNLKWDFVTNFGTQKSTLTRTADGKDIPLVWSNAATYTLRAGEQVGTIYGYKALTSVDQKDKNGAPYIDPANASDYELVNGRVVDKNSKLVQFTPDKYYLGNTTPKFNMAFINNFAYKNYLTFSFQVDWVYGSKTYNQTKEWMYSEGLHGDYDNPVTINGETGAFTAYYKSFYDASESNGTKDYFLENSSFARLRNVSVGFDFAKFFDMKRFSRLQLIFTGRNLATITNYTGMDPEASQNTSGGGTTSASPQVATQRGLDFWSFPNFKSFQVGLNVSFN